MSGDSIATLVICITLKLHYHRSVELGRISALQALEIPDS